MPLPAAGDRDALALEKTGHVQSLSCRTVSDPLSAPRFAPVGPLPSAKQVGRYRDADSDTKAEPGGTCG